MKIITSQPALEELDPYGCAEDDILIWCAGLYSSPEGIAAALTRKIDWDYLLATAGRHGLTPALFKKLSTAFPDLVPRETLELLRAQYQGNNLRNLFLTAEMIRLLGAFEQNQIRALPYKGPTLTALAYDNLALREFLDLDILVRQEDVPKAAEVLTSCGYYSETSFAGSQQEALLENEYVLTFWRDEPPNIVELHWEVVPRYLRLSLDFDRLWARAVTVPIAGKSVLTPAVEDLLLLLTVHGGKHLWERLGWIVDVARLIESRKDLNWDQVYCAAAESGSERMLGLGLLLASDLLGATMPPRVRERVRSDKELEGLVRRVRGRLFSAGGFGGLSVFKFHLRMHERMADRLRYCMHIATTPSIADLTFLSLPKWASFLYSLLRPLRLVKTYAYAALMKRPARAVEPADASSESHAAPENRLPASAFERGRSVQDSSR